MAALFMVAAPAYAQFGSIFRDDGPPRPPADVPNVSAVAAAHVSEPVSQPAAAQFPSQRPAAVRSAAGADEPAALKPPGRRQHPIATAAAANRRAGGASAAAGPAAASPTAATPTAARRNGAPIQTLPGLPPGTKQPRGAAPQQPANTAPQPGDEIVVEPPPQRISNPTAVFAGLDKITGRIISFDVAINETVQFGALQVTPRVCYSRPPTETPNTDAFVEVDEVTLQGEIKRIFTGWMYVLAFPRGELVGALRGRGPGRPRRRRRRRSPA